MGDGVPDSGPSTQGRGASPPLVKSFSMEASLAHHAGLLPSKAPWKPSSTHPDSTSTSQQANLSSHVPGIGQGAETCDVTTDTIPGVVGLVGGETATDQTQTVRGAGTGRLAGHASMGARDTGPSPPHKAAAPGSHACTPRLCSLPVSTPGLGQEAGPHLSTAMATSPRPRRRLRR